MAFRSRASRFWVSALIESLTSMSCFMTLGSRLNLFRAEPALSSTWMALLRNDWTPVATTPKSWCSGERMASAIWSS